MKKIITIIMAVFICLTATACGQKELNIEPEKFADKVKENVKFEEELEQIDPEMIKVLYKINTDDVKSTVYMGSGATAEEIAIFKATDENKANDILKIANNHIEEQKEDFSSYNPKEIKKLDDAVVMQKGNYVIICVTEDENANKIIKKCLG